MFAFFFFFLSLIEIGCLLYVLYMVFGAYYYFVDIANGARVRMSSFDRFETRNHGIINLRASAAGFISHAYVPLALPIRRPRRRKRPPQRRLSLWNVNVGVCLPYAVINTSCLFWTSKTETVPPSIEIVWTWIYTGDGPLKVTRERIFRTLKIQRAGARIAKNEIFKNNHW